jgi:hypothetical protein
MKVELETSTSTFPTVQRSSWFEMAVAYRIDKLKEGIVKHLQERYRATGVNAPVLWATVWIELGVPAEDFSQALQAAGNDILIVDDEHIKLTRSGLNRGY